VLCNVHLEQFIPSPDLAFPKIPDPHSVLSFWNWTKQHVLQKTGSSLRLWPILLYQYTYFQNKIPERYMDSNPAIQPNPQHWWWRNPENMDATHTWWWYCCCTADISWWRPPSLRCSSPRSSAPSDQAPRYNKRRLEQFYSRPRMLIFISRCGVSISHAFIYKQPDVGITHARKFRCTGGKVGWGIEKEKN
jgi:hypothetical protein